MYQSSISEEDNARCWEYVMKFSLQEIQQNQHSELNTLCSHYIDSKESFIRYVDDKRKSVRQMDNGGNSSGSGNKNGMYVKPSSSG